VKRIQVILNKVPAPLQRGDNNKIVKIGWGLLKIFSRTTRPILTRLGTNHPWGKWIQVCSNEGDCPSPRGGNSKSKNTLGTYYPWVKGIQVCSIKGPGPLQMGDNYKNVKMRWGHLKILFLRTLKPEKTVLPTPHPTYKARNSQQQRSTK
jgi:hypothetical protein